MPLISWLHGQKIEPSVIMTGGKVMSIDLATYKLRFLDSLNYLPMSLKAIPKAMGLPTEVKKMVFFHII